MRTKNTTLRYIVVKLMKSNNKEDILETARGEKTNYFQRKSSTVSNSAVKQDNGTWKSLT